MRRTTVNAETASIIILSFFECLNERAWENAPEKRPDKGVLDASDMTSTCMGNPSSTPSWSNSSSREVRKFKGKDPPGHRLPLLHISRDRCMGDILPSNERRRREFREWRMKNEGDIMRPITSMILECLFFSHSTQTYPETWTCMAWILRKRCSATCLMIPPPLRLAEVWTHTVLNRPFQAPDDLLSPRRYQFYHQPFAIFFLAPHLSNGSHTYARATMIKYSIFFQIFQEKRSVPAHLPGSFSDRKATNPKRKHHHSSSINNRSTLQVKRSNPSRPPIQMDLFPR